MKRCPPLVDAGQQHQDTEVGAAGTTGQLAASPRRNHPGIRVRPGVLGAGYLVLERPGIDGAARPGPDVGVGGQPEEPFERVPGSPAAGRDPVRGVGPSRTAFLPWSPRIIDTMGLVRQAMTGERAPREGGTPAGESGGDNSESSGLRPGHNVYASNGSDGHAAELIYEPLEEGVAPHTPDC